MPTKRQATARKKATSIAPVEGQETCFTIMPFGGGFDSYYESIYIPAIRAAGLEPCRADDLYRPSTIIHDIWSYTQSAKLVLADLSGKNANVFYERSNRPTAANRPKVAQKNSLEISYLVGAT